MEGQKEIKIPKHELDSRVKIGDIVVYNRELWIVEGVNVDLSYTKGTGILLSDKITPPRLKKEIKDLLEYEEGDHNLQSQDDKMILLYYRLIKQEPHNDINKFSLAKLLFDQAIRQKRKSVTRQKAKELFLEVLKLNPAYTKIHLCEYQLGFLYEYEKEWPSAIRHFKKAIASGRLDYFQMLRAYCHLGVCYSQNNENEEALRCIEKAKELDIESRCTPEIEMASSQINKKIENEYKPYLLITRKKSEPISADEAMDIAESGHDNFVVVDCRFIKTVFNGPRNSVILSAVSGELLRLLLSANAPLTSEDIAAKLETTKSKKPGNVRVHVNQLRNKIHPCFEEEGIELISSTENGWQWNHDYPFKMIVTTSF